MRVKKFQKIMAFVLAAVMCLGLASTAFAEDAKGTAGAADNSAEAAVTKKVTFAEGETLPASTEFTFKFVAVPDDDTAKHTTSEKAAITPAIADVKITVTKANGESANSAAVNGVKTATLQSGNIFAGLIDASKNVKTENSFPHAGVYEYIVYEDQTAITDFTLSKEQYRIYVYVANELDATNNNQPTGKLFIKNIGTVLESFPGTATPGTPGTPGTEKVDPTPGTPGSQTDPTYAVTDSPSKLAFTNAYQKTGGGDPKEDDDQMIEVEKKVTGAFADATKYFEFDVQLTKSATVSTATAGVTYKGYVVKADNSAVVTSTDNFATIKGPDAAPNDYGKYIEFTIDKGGSVVTQTIKLQPGQKLVFTEKTLVGAKLDITENAAAGYKPSQVKYQGGAAGTPDTATNYGDPITVPQITVTKPADGSTSAYQNGAVVTNAASDIPITGISMDNLPFIVLIAVACAALVAFVVVKSKSRKNHSANH